MQTKYFPIYSEFCTFSHMFNILIINFLKRETV